MALNTKIDFSWLKQTPVGSKGIIPGVGLRYVHIPGGCLHCEQIWIHDGNDDIRIIKTNRYKSGWSAADRIPHGRW